MTDELWALVHAIDPSKCDTVCEHGGTCTLPTGHLGRHEAWAFKWLGCTWPQETAR